jgi:hypothetical protein
VAQGELAEALASYEAGLAIRERLAAQDPGNAQWQRDLIVSGVKLGGVAERAGSINKARQRYEGALATARALSDRGRLAPADLWIIGDLETRLGRL